MLEKIEETVDALGRGGDGIGHDLRTPLVAVRADSEGTGLERLTGSPGPDRSVFEGPGTRETWERQPGGDYRWTLEQRDPGAEERREALVVELVRRTRAQ